METFDAVQDARSEARYETDPRAEPEQWELDFGTVTAAPDEPERVEL